MKYAMKLALTLAFAIVTIPASANEYLQNEIFVDRPWARATPPVEPINAAVYLTLENRSGADIRLASVSTTLSDDVSIHQTREMDGMMRMEPLPQGIPVAAGESVALTPGGYHIMLKGLEHPLVRGGQFPMTLKFADGQSMDVTVNINNDDPMENHAHDHH